MARKSKKLQNVQKIWEERISRAKQVKTYWKELFKVQLALDYLDGKQRPENYNADEWITINNVYSHLKSQLPALYSSDPYFHVSVKRSYTPVRKMIEQYEKKAKVRQSNLNYYKDELKLKTKARLGIQDAMFSFGVLRVEHASTVVENPDKGQPIYKEKPEGAGDDYTPEPMTDDDGNEILEPETIPVNSRYVIARVHPDDFLFDEDAGPLEDSWNWIAERVRVPYEDVESNPLFKKAAVKSLKGKGIDEDDEEKARSDRKKGGDIKDNKSGQGYFKAESDKVAPELVCLWKIWDLKKKKWLVIAENGDEPLVAETDLPKGVEDHPYSVLRFTLRDDSPYPIPPMSQGIDPAREYNMARSDILKHRKRFNRKYEVFVNAFEDPESEIAKLETGDDGTCIKKNINAPVVTPIQDAQLDQMRWQEMGYLRNEMIELFGGSTGESRGIAEADSATQAGILDSRLQMKEGDSLSMVIDWIKDLARKLDQVIQANIDTVQAVRITGADGIDYMEVISPEDYEAINGEFVYDVNVGSTMPKLPQMERASWLAFLQLLGNVPPLMTSKRLLKRMAELHHIEDETLIEEIRQIGLKMMQSQAEPAKTGSMPNVTENNPAAAIGGQVGGAAVNQTGQ